MTAAARDQHALYRIATERSIGMSYTFRPTEGMLLLFPSWLDHIVGQNKSDDVRVSISFNIDLVTPKA